GGRAPGGDDGGVRLAGTDDRRGPPWRDPLGAKIDDPVRRRIDDEAPRFVTEGPAGEEADNRAAAAGGRPPRPVEGAHAAGGQLHRGGRAPPERRPPGPPRGRPPVRTAQARRPPALGLDR